MSQTGKDNEPAQQMPLQTFIPTEIAVIANKQLRAMMEIQGEFIEALEGINSAWLDRAASEATLTSELVSDLSEARSLPETADAYKVWLAKQMEIAADDSRRFFAGSQKFMELGMRFLTNGIANPSLKAK